MSNTTDRQSAAVGLVPGLTPRPILAPTPIQIPLVKAYMIGDVMRAFGLVDDTVQLLQRGFSEGDLAALEVIGVDTAGIGKYAQHTDYGDINIAGTLSVDTKSQVSVLGQMSKKIERSIIEALAEIKRRGLKIEFRMHLSPKGLTDYDATLARYNLTPSKPVNYDPAIRQMVSHRHKPTGMVFTFKAAW